MGTDFSSPYVYANNSPHNFNDPSGLAPEKDHGEKLMDQELDSKIERWNANQAAYEAETNIMSGILASISSYLDGVFAYMRYMNELTIDGGGGGSGGRSSGGNNEMNSSRTREGAKNDEEDDGGEGGDEEDYKGKKPPELSVEIDVDKVLNSENNESSGEINDSGEKISDAQAIVDALSVGNELTGLWAQQVNYNLYPGAAVGNGFNVFGGVLGIAKGQIDYNNGNWIGAARNTTVGLMNIGQLFRMHPYARYTLFGISVASGIFGPALDRHIHNTIYSTTSSFPTYNTKVVPIDNTGTQYRRR